MGSECAGVTIAGLNLVRICVGRHTQGTVRRPVIERSPAARLLGADLRGGDFEAMEKLGGLEQLQRKVVEEPQVTLPEKRMSMFCFRWRAKQRDSVEHVDSESVYLPSTHTLQPQP